MTDAEWIAQFQAGQTTAYNALAQRWQGPIYNFILRYVGNREDARDLCQQTFIRVYRNLKQLRDPGKFPSWVYQIAHNTCRDAARSRRLMSLDALCERDDIPVSLVMDAMLYPDAMAHGQGVRDLLNRALQTLPEEQRVVIVMKEYQGLKFSEIAEALETPVNTVKSRMYYGLSALKQLFDQWQITEDMVRYDL